MDYFVYLLFAVALVILFVFAKRSGTREARKVHKNNIYSYTAKPLPMTPTEATFFQKLDRTVSERYYVFPQVHLSAILDYRVKGQDWHYAFRHINGKSVDFVLCDKQTLAPIYAIELDDYTHDQPDRRKRDAEVERIFEESGLPLIRIKDKQIDSHGIIRLLSNVRPRL